MQKTQEFPQSDKKVFIALENFMCFQLGSFYPGEIIRGKILKLDPKGALVNFEGDREAFVPLLELSLAEIQSPEEAVKVGEIREFLVVANYDGDGNIFFSHCSPETLEGSERLQQTLYQHIEEIAQAKGQSYNKGNIIIHTKFVDTYRGGVSVKFQWFLCSQALPATVSCSIRRLEIQKAWERVRQLQSENVTVYAQIQRKITRGAIVKVEGLHGCVRIYVDRHKEKLIAGKVIPLKILEVSEEDNQLVTIDPSVLMRLKQLEIGQIVSGKIRFIKDYGIFVDIGDLCALLPVSKMRVSGVDRPEQLLEVNQNIRAKIVEINLEIGRAILESYNF